MKELVIISGKGGTGKTSIVSALAALAQPVVLADCDVDASDLHLVVDPHVYWKEAFYGGFRARVLSGHCTACGKCEEVCQFDAVFYDGPGNGMVEKTFRINPIACERCGVCAWFCPSKAIEFKLGINGEWYKSDTRFGPMVFAKLGIAEENSGKLVTLVRKEAKKIAEEQSIDLILVDGSPGIGCPVKASMTGADAVLIVTEPTLSGLHDLKRVAELSRQFEVQTFVCINKWDLNADVSKQIEKVSREMGLIWAGKIRYDRAFTAAQIEKKTLIEYRQNGPVEEIRKLWSVIKSG